MGMIRYIIRDKKTGKYLRKTSTGKQWVESVNEATLMTSASGASLVATQFCGKDEYKRQIRYYARGVSYNNYPVEVIKVGVLLYPMDKQPLIDGFLK